MVLNTKIALNYVLALTPSFQAALKFEKWDTEKKFPLFKVRLVGTGIKFQAINVLGLLTYLFSISFYPHFKKNEKSQKSEKSGFRPIFIV